MLTANAFRTEARGRLSVRISQGLTPAALSLRLDPRLLLPVIAFGRFMLTQLYSFVNTVLEFYSLPCGKARIIWMAYLFHLGDIVCRIENGGSGVASRENDLHIVRPCSDHINKHIFR